jgi:Arc/MetJ-type ribon-helix-helix transcriptional regulator
MREGETLPPREGRKPRTVTVSFHVPKTLLEAVDELVEMGLFNSRSEVIRAAIFNLLRELEMKRREKRAKPEVGYR